MTDYRIGSIARPDFILAVLVAALTGAAVAFGPQSMPQGRALLIILPTLVTLVALSQRVQPMPTAP